MLYTAINGIKLGTYSAPNHLNKFRDAILDHNELMCPQAVHQYHDDVIKGKHFARYWPFVRGIHRWPVNSPHKGQWFGALMYSLICAWIHRWVNNREAGDLRRRRAHYDVIVMIPGDEVHCPSGSYNPCWIIHLLYNREHQRCQAALSLFYGHLTFGCAGARRC